MNLAIHDPCTTRHFPDIQNAARNVAAQLGVSVNELDLGRENTECCGFGGLMENANPELAKQVAGPAGDKSAPWIT